MRSRTDSDVLTRGCQVAIKRLGRVATGTTSLPFKPGERKTIAVKVIDPRGNEVMRVHRLGAANYAEED